MVKLSVTLVFAPVSMEQRRRATINGPPHSEACFHLELVLTTGARHDGNDLGQFELAVPILIYPAVTQGLLSELR